MSDPVIILGASARAAAFSAFAAGYSPVCADLFADTDLLAIARCTAVRDYPRGLLDVARQLPPGPWLYTGGLENYPLLVNQIARDRPLYGNGGDVLKRVREPFRWQQDLKEFGLSLPDVRRSAKTLPQDGSWLRKPIRGSGGTHITTWTEEVACAISRSGDGQHVADDLNTAPHFFFQERKPGIPSAAVFVAAAGRAVLLGATRQITGADWTGASEFCYAGSIGPLSIPQDHRVRLEAAGNRIAERFQMTGLFGIDYLDAGDELWLIEINPRYPASAEVLERATDTRTRATETRATGTSLVATHVAACTRQVLPDRSSFVGQAENAICGKAIVFAEQDVIISPAFTDWATSLNAESNRYAVADVPAAGTLIPTGNPIATVLADDTTHRDVEASLQQRATALREHLVHEARRSAPQAT